jgi:hypothetical protein
MARSIVLLLLALVPVSARADVQTLAKCQRSIAREGAKFAQKVIKSTLNCSEAVINCQVQCDAGVFGPSCDEAPPPCCDSNDPNSNQAFGQCMSEAQQTCDEETTKQATYETNKQAHITAACTALTQDELCGAQTEGLNFATLNAGCAALDPNYTCNLTNLVNCVGGPLERAFLEQISATLSPRVSDAVAALNLQAKFPDVPVAQRVKGTVAAGKVDIWQFSGQAGDAIVARVNTRDDSPDNSKVSTLHPLLTLLDATTTPVADTPVHNANCAVTNVCGSACPVFKRTLPFDGNFRLAVQGAVDGACTGGKYKLILITPGGVVPTQIADDVDPPGP